MAEYGHDLVRATSGLGQTSPSSLAQAMRLTTRAAVRRRNCLTKPLTEAIDRELAAILRY